MSLTLSLLRRRLAPALAWLALLPAGAQAEPDIGSLELLASDAKASPVPKGFLPGAALISLQARYADGNATLLPVPGFIYIGDKLMFLGDRARYYFYRDQHLAAFAFGRIRTGNLNPEKVDAFAGMNRRKWEAEAGVGANLITSFGLFTARVASDITGTSKGQEALLWADFPMVFNRLLVMPGAGVMWRSSKLANYYFGGVSPEESAPGRPTHDTGATLSPMVSLINTYRLSDKWLATLSFGYEHYDRSIADSPLVRHKGEAFMIAGVGYIW